ncbi:MAG: hypothetical protein U0487_01400 [Patescibacteria group bacterium]
MHQPLHVFIGTVYPRFADMHEERVIRLQEHDARITMIHEYLAQRRDIVITNPLNDIARRTSDVFPSLGLPGVSTNITDDPNEVLREERLKESVRLDLVSISKANLAIIDLTYLESSYGIIELMKQADELKIPTLLVRFGESAASPYQSVARERRYIACYTNDYELRAHVHDALEMLFPYSRREEKTDPQIPSKIVAFRKQGS